MYHYVRDLKNSKYPNIKGLDLDLFRKQIHFLRQKFDIISMEDVIDVINKTKKLPEKALLLTFDDGYIDHYSNVFPILKENGIQGSFFIPGKTFFENKLLDVNKIHFVLASAPIDELYNDVLLSIDSLTENTGYNGSTKEELIEKYAISNRFDSKEVVFVKRILQTVLPEEIRNKITSELFHKYVGVSESEFAKELYMNLDQIKEMKKEGMYIGIHGYDHYWLGNLNEEKMKNDLENALNALDGVVDKDNWVINYPYGSYNDKVVDYIKQKGCVLGLTTEVRVADLDRDNRFLLPRLDCNDFPPKSDNYLNY